MNRKDYRKMMQRKKMNKLYSRSLILAVLGLGVTISGNTVKAEAREWKANTSTTIKKGDTEYKILWGDTLSLISRDSGITIETLTKLNNILDANLIYEGNILVFGNGATATVKDNNGNVIAETPLTPADKQGIKEAQNNNTKSTNNTTTSNVNTSNGSNIGSNNTNSGGNSSNGNTTSNKPTKPSKPEKPEEKPETPVAKEVTATVNYLEDGNIIHTTTEKVKLGEDGFGTVNAVAPIGYDIVGDTSATVSETNTNVVFNVKKQAPAVEKVNVPVIYNLVDADGTFIKTLETSTQEFTKGDTVTVTAPTTVQGNTIVGSASQSVTVTDGTQVVFNYVAPYVPVHTTENVTVNVDESGNVLSSTDGYEKVSESTDAGVTTTQANGDTHTVYTTTVVWKKVVVTPPTTGGVSGEQFGGRLTSQSETDSELPVNGYTFPDKASATAYGYANQDYIASLPENTSGRDDFLIFSVTMKDGSVRWAIEWKYILNG